MENKEIVSRFVITNVTAEAFLLPSGANSMIFESQLGMFDVLSPFMLIVLPLYPKHMEEAVLQ